MKQISVLEIQDIYQTLVLSDGSTTYVSIFKYWHLKETSIRFLNSTIQLADVWYEVRRGDRTETFATIG